MNIVEIFSFEFSATCFIAKKLLYVCSNSRGTIHSLFILRMLVCTNSKTYSQKNNQVLLSVEYYSQKKQEISSKIESKNENLMEVKEQRQNIYLY